MGESGGFDGEIDLPGGSFSRLLLSNDQENIDRSSSFHVANNSTTTAPSPLFSSNTPKMLCFGDFSSEITHLLSSPSTLTNTFTDVPSASSSGNNAITILNNKKRNGSGSGLEFEQGLGNGQRFAKKRNKPEMLPTSTAPVGNAKGRREKLGERITALQQLVCPYGKTDTASVLHEAMGYIRFLQDQVKVLSSPYLQRLSSSSSSPHHPLSVTEMDMTSVEGSTKGLRSRGLCLVPVECIDDIANSNGADFWASTANSTSSFAL